MIVALLLGCGEADDTASPAPDTVVFAPTFGPWTAHVGDTWTGDCALEDPNTYQKADQPWVLEDDRAGFAVRDDAGYRYACALDDVAFVCPLPVIADDFASLGYDIRATYTPTWEGTFSDASHLSGAYRVEATCEGEDCDLLTGYGEDFTFPCGVQTGLEASAE